MLCYKDEKGKEFIKRETFGKKNKRNLKLHFPGNSQTDRQTGWEDKHVKICCLPGLKAFVLHVQEAVQ